MKYPFPVKHNGVLYEPGQVVPIGKEPVKENEDNDKSVNEIKAELKELGVTKFPSNKKADLLALLEETKAAADADEEVEDEEVIEDSEEEEEETEADEDVTENEDEESDLLDEIVNE